MTSASYWGQEGFLFFFFLIYLFIWLHQVFVAAGRIFFSLSLLVVACIGKDPDDGKD